MNEDELRQQSRMISRLIQDKELDLIKIQRFPNRDNKPNQGKEIGIKGDILRLKRLKDYVKNYNKIKKLCI